MATGTLFTAYRPHPNGKENHKIKFTIHFNKELSNWATGQPKKLGYYINATPIEEESRNGYTIQSSVAFSGFNALIFEVDRQSSKRLDTAVKSFHERTEEFMEFFRLRTKKENQEEKELIFS